MRRKNGRNFGRISSSKVRRSGRKPNEDAWIQSSREPARRGRGSLRAGHRAGQTERHGRGRRLVCGSRPAAEADRGCEEGGRAQHLHLGAVRRHGRPGRRLREEIRSEGQRVARKLGEGAAARRRRSAGQPQHRGHRRDQRPRNGIAAPRKSPATGQVAAPRRPDRAGDTPPRRVGRTRLNVFVQAYNTKAVKKEELPKTWEDLLDPKWKGRLGIEQEDSDWLAGMFDEIGEAKGTKLFKEIVARNGMSVRKGHTLLAQLVVSGEVPLALTVYNYKAEQFKGKGAPIDWFSIGTAIARPNGVGVARRAPHPHAAVLFYDFEISEEGQKILAQRDFVPTNRKIDTPLNKLPLKFVDARVTLDEYDKWAKLYEEIFGKGR